MRKIRRYLIGTVVGILLALVSVTSVFAEEVPAEYKEFWDKWQQKAAELGTSGFVYDSSLLEAREHSKSVKLGNDEKWGIKEISSGYYEWLDLAYKEQYMDITGSIESLSVSGPALMTLRRAVVYEDHGNLYLFGSRLPKDGSNHWSIAVSRGSSGYTTSGMLTSELQYIENGTPVQDGWRQIGLKGKWFFFKDGIASSPYGQVAIDGKYYLFDYYGASGSYGMQTDHWSNSKYYGSDGAMLVNTVTPDGYRVGDDGEKISRVELLDSSAYALERQSETVKSMYETINAYRQANGKSPLRWDQRYSAAITTERVDSIDYGIKLKYNRGGYLLSPSDGMKEWLLDDYEIMHVKTEPPIFHTDLYSVWLNSEMEY